MMDFLILISNKQGASWLLASFRDSSCFHVASFTVTTKIFLCWLGQLMPYSLEVSIIQAKLIPPTIKLKTRLLCQVIEVSTAM